MLKLTGNVWLSQEKIKDHPAHVWDMDGAGWGHDQSSHEADLDWEMKSATCIYTEVNKCMREREKRRDR